MFAQSDITGWYDLPWGATKSQAAKALERWHVRDCRVGKNSCPTAATADDLVIDSLRVNATLYSVDLLFESTRGLRRAVMIADDQKGALDRALADLSKRYNKPEFQSEYDGDQEQIYNKWTWTKPHGRISLESLEGAFRVTFEAR